MRKLLTIILCLFMTITCVNIVRADSDTVYLDPQGTSSHSEDVYTTFQDAINALPSTGGTIIVCSDATINSGTSSYAMPAKAVTIRGESANVKLTQTYRVFMNADLTIENINWESNVGSSNSFLFTQGFNLTVGDNVTSTMVSGKSYISILAGTTSSPGKAKTLNVNETITLRSGTFASVFAGSLSYAVSGTVNINVIGATISKQIYLTGSGAKGVCSATVNINVSDGNVAKITNTHTSGSFTGVANIVLKGGIIGTMPNLTPSINLSEGGNLTLNSTLAVSSITGGGTLNLGNNVTLSANSFTGDMNLSIDNPVLNTTYITISDPSSTGNINYLAQDKEILKKYTSTNIIYAVEEDGGGEIADTVYLDPLGTSSHSENVYTTFDAAIKALPSTGGTIYVCSNATFFNDSENRYVMPAKAVHIIGESSSVRLSQLNQIYAQADMEIENITWVNEAPSNSAFLFAQGHDITVGENVTCVANASYYLCILAGSRGYDDTAGNMNGVNCTITIKSGTFRSLFGAGMNASGSVNGTVTYNILGGTVGMHIYACGSGTGGNLTGTFNLNISGGNVVDASKYSTNGSFTGTANLNITGGTIGTINDFEPIINLSGNKTVSLNGPVNATSLIGGGTLNLGNNGSIVADLFSGNVVLNLTNPVDDQVYLTINDLATSGTVDYNALYTETLERRVNTAVEYYIHFDDQQEEKTVYVDPLGTSSHSEDVYTTVADAIDALPYTGGRVVICSDVDFNPSANYYILPDKKVTIVGETADVQLILLHSIFLGAETTIENLNLVNNVSSSYAFIFAQGHNLTIGENITTVPNSDNYNLCLLMGSRGVSGAAGKITDGNCTLTVKSGTFRSIFGAGMNASGTYSGTVNINFEGGTIKKAINACGSSANFNGTFNLTVTGGTIPAICKNTDNASASGSFAVRLKGGTIGSVTDLVPVIDLSTGGTLNLNKSLTVNSLKGGGKLVLASNAALTTNSFIGNIDLEIKIASGDFTYLTINDPLTEGVISYTPGVNEELQRRVSSNKVEYVMIKDKTHVKITYYNPDGASKTQPNILLYKGYASDDETKAQITDYTSGMDGYKNYIEADLNPGLHYFFVYYNKSSDYVRKYFYITGEETEDLVYDMPFIPYTADANEESYFTISTDQVLNKFWNFEDIDHDPIELVTPTFTMDKYLRNNRKFMNNEDMCAFIDSLSSPYLHVYYPFDLTPKGNKFPVLIFTKDNVASDISIENLAQEVVNNGTREIILMNGVQHGNEPAGSDGTLQLAYRLTTDSAYANYVLDNIGCIIIVPVVQLDNNQRFSRMYESGLNSNRDMLYLSGEGNQNLVHIYNLFMPTEYISCHENNEFLTVDPTDYSIQNIQNVAYSCLSTLNTPITDINGLMNGTWSIGASDNVMMIRHLIDKANDQGFRAVYYHDVKKYCTNERSYMSARGAFSFVIEVQRIWSGKTNYDYAVKTMQVSLENVIDEIITTNNNSEKTLAERVKEARENVRVSEFSDEHKFVLDSRYHAQGTVPFPSIYVDGTYKDKGAIQTWYAHDEVLKYRILPLSYVIPADSNHIDDILNLLTLHGISYNYLPAGTTKILKEYTITDSSNNRTNPIVEIGENAEVTFENGAYEVSLDTYNAYIIAFLFEPDSLITSTLYLHSFYNMSYLDLSDHLYRYESDELPTGSSSTVTFMYKGSTYQTINDVSYNSLIEKPADPIEEGYILEGWYKDSNFTNKFFFDKSRITEDTTLYAKMAVPHTFTFKNVHNVSASAWIDNCGGIPFNTSSDTLKTLSATAAGDYKNSKYEDSSGEGRFYYGFEIRFDYDSSVLNGTINLGGIEVSLSKAYLSNKATAYLDSTGSWHSSLEDTDTKTYILKYSHNAGDNYAIIRLYNMSTDIDVVLNYSTISIDYIDSESVLSSLEYNQKIIGYEPEGNIYVVPLIALSNKDDTQAVNLHLELKDVVGIRLNDVEITDETLVQEIVDYGDIVVSITKGNLIVGYDILIKQLSGNLTISPILAKATDKTVSGNLNNDGTVNLVISADIDASVDLEKGYVLVDGHKTLLKDLDNEGLNVSLTTNSLSPKNLGDKFVIRYYDGNNNPISNEINISIADYVNMLIDDTHTSETAKDFYISILNYATYAQVYFNHDIDDLVNKDLTTSQKDVSGVSHNDVIDKIVNVTGSVEGISPYGQSLKLKDKVDYKVYFTLDGSVAINEYSFYDGDNPLNPIRVNNNMYYVLISNTAAPDLDESHTIRVTRNTESLNVTCSVLTYVELVLRDAPVSEEDIKLTDLVKALYLYNQNANAVFGG